MKDGVSTDGQTRQRRWQMRQIAAGRCSVCGRKRVTSKFCELHRRRFNARSRERYKEKVGAK